MVPRPSDDASATGDAKASVWADGQEPLDHPELDERLQRLAIFLGPRLDKDCGEPGTEAFREFKHAAIKVGLANVKPRDYSAPSEQERRERRDKAFEQLLARDRAKEDLLALKAQEQVASSVFLRDRHRATDLGDPEPLRWLVRGVLADATYGALAGPKKALKTHIAGALVVSVAAGLPLFGLDAFAVPEARPVLAYVGEGGRAPFERRLRRIARSYGVDARKLPVEYRVGVAQGGALVDRLARDLEEVGPALWSTSTRSTPSTAPRSGPASSTSAGRCSPA